jgi:formylglycine-generating enzyme required for sulfatase activity
MMPEELLMKTTIALCLLFAFALINRGYADTFGSGASTFNIDFVTIGNPGNASDTSSDPSSIGAVSYTYRIAKYEISAAMIDKANSLSTAAGSPLGITRAADADINAAAYFINWNEAAKFANWLDTSTGNIPAYKFNSSGTLAAWAPGDLGFNPANVIRNSLAKYYLPNEDEWYKAAYYDPTLGVYYDYPTGSNTPPIAVNGGTVPGTAVYNRPGLGGPADITNAGGLSPYGTMAQGGNVWEWLESPIDLSSPQRYYRGTGWPNADLPNQHFSTNENTIGTLGIRVGSTAVPEPSSIALGLLALALHTRRRRLSSYNRV